MYNTDVDQQIVIIGAGAAGLSAAHALHAAGHTPLVLEARDRIGGRIWTTHTPGLAELGAEFVHGEHAATWQHIRAAQLDALPWEGERCFVLNGQRLGPSDSAYQHIVSVFESIAHSLASPTSSECSVDAWLRRTLPPDDPARAVVARWLGNLEAADMTHLSAQGVARCWQEWRAGWRNHRISAGYARVPHLLARGVPVRRNAPVAQVCWNEQLATLTLASNEQIRARHVLVTVPLGVLQAGQPGFVPDLPPRKQHALRALAMGQVCKLVLWFTRPFWPDFGYLHTDGVVISWWPTPDTQVPGMVGYAGGTPALRLAALGERAAIEQGLTELTALFGTDARAQCVGGRLVAWSHDPWSRGGYSYPAVGEGNARTDLAAPVGQTLFFAGEATATSGHHATVHGAIESGQRAAAELLAVVQRPA